MSETKTAILVPPMDRPALAFTVAVTGHIELHQDQIDRIRRQLGSLFPRLAACLNRGIAAGSLIDPTAPVELRCLTALAAGADQLVADVLPDRSSSGGWRLNVILPFARDDYVALLAQRQKTDVAVAGEMLALGLQRAGDAVMEIADSPSDCWGQTDEACQYWRALRYRTLGSLLVHQADLLVAIWDGMPEHGPGGTAEVVQEAIRVGLPVVWICSQPLKNHATMFGIVGSGPGATAVGLAAEASAKSGWTREERRKQFSDPTAASGAQLTTPLAAMKAAIVGVLRPQGTVTSRLTGLAPLIGAGPNLQPKRHTNKWLAYQWLTALPAGQRPRLRVPCAYELENHEQREASNVLTASERRLGKLFGITDAVATLNGHRYRSSYVAIFLAAAAAVFFGLFGLVTHAVPKWVMILCEIGWLLTAGWLFGRAQHGRWHRQWLNARHVAESLRGNILLAELGFCGRRPVVEPTDANADAPWSAWLANTYAALPGIPHDHMTLSRLVEIAKDARRVVGGQIAYHRGNHVRLEAMHRLLDQLGWGAVSIAAIVAIAYLIVDPGLHLLSEQGSETFKGITTFFAGFFPALAAAAAGMRYQADFERFADRSHKTAGQLTEADSHLQRFIADAEALASSRKSCSSPMFERLASIMLAVREIFERDLEDWRLVYASRPVNGL